MAAVSFGIQMLLAPGPTHQTQSSTNVTEGPRLTDLAVQQSNYGAPIPIVYGSMRFAGTVIWSRPIKEVKTTKTTVTTIVQSSRSGKGGGGTSTSTSTSTQITILYDYFITMAVGVCRGPMGAITRMWADNKLIMDLTPGNKGKKYKYDEGIYRIYLQGDKPDSSMMHYEQNTTPGYRDWCYIVLNTFPLKDFGNHIPQFTVEVASDAVGAVTTSTVPGTTPLAGWSCRALTIDQSTAIAVVTRGNNLIGVNRVANKVTWSKDVSLISESVTPYFGSGSSASGWGFYTEPFFVNGNIFVGISTYVWTGIIKVNPATGVVGTYWRYPLPMLPGGGFDLGPLGGIDYYVIRGMTKTSFIMMDGTLWNMYDGRAYSTHGAIVSWPGNFAYLSWEDNSWHDGAMVYPSSFDHCALGFGDRKVIHAAVDTFDLGIHGNPTALHFDNDTGYLVIVTERNTSSITVTSSTTYAGHNAIAWRNILDYRVYDATLGTLFTDVSLTIWTRYGSSGATGNVTLVASDTANFTSVDDLVTYILGKIRDVSVDYTVDHVSTYGGRFNIGDTYLQAQKDACLYVRMVGSDLTFQNPFEDAEICSFDMGKKEVVERLRMADYNMNFYGDTETSRNNPVINGVLYGTSGGGNAELYKIDTRGMQLEERITFNTPFNIVYAWYYDGVTQKMWSQEYFTGSSHAGQVVSMSFGESAKTAIDLADVVTDLSNMVGVRTDATGLPDSFTGYFISKQTTVRACIDGLRSAFLFDAAEIAADTGSGNLVGTVVYRKRNRGVDVMPRGSKSPVVIPWGNIVFLENSSSSQQRNRITETRQQEAEIPRRITVRYGNPANAFQAGSQIAQRNQPTTESKGEMTVDLPLAISDAQAANIAQQLLGSAWTERSLLEFLLPPKYILLDPTDIILLEKIDRSFDSTYGTPIGTRTLIMCRLTEVLLAEGYVLQCKAVVMASSSDPIYVPLSGSS